MKAAIAILAAGVLSASATIVHAQQMAPAGATPGQITPAPQPQGMQVGGGVALPKLPANLQDPSAATKASADVFAVMQALQQHMQMLRQQAVQQRNQARDNQVAALQQAAEKMKQAATAAMQVAQVNGAMQIAGGATQIGQGQAAQGQIGQAKNAAAQERRQAGQISKFDSLTPTQQQQVVGTITNAQQAFIAHMKMIERERERVGAALSAAAPNTNTKVTAQQQAQLAQMEQFADQQVRQMQETIRQIQEMMQRIMAEQMTVAQKVARVRFAQ